MYDDTEFTQYFSVDDCNSNTNLYSWYSDNGIVSNDDYLVCDGNNVWDAISGPDLMTMSTLWGMKQAYLYYLNVHGHEGFSGTGGLIDGFSNRLFYKDDGSTYCTNAEFVFIIDNL